MAISTTVLLQTRFTQAYLKAFGRSFALPAIAPTKDPKFGDYQCNDALGLAKVLQRSPLEIAAQIVAALEIEDVCLTPAIAPPGFINLTLNPSYLAQILTGMHQSDRLGIDRVTEPQRVIVDFSSPNIAKEMHVGHLRSTIIGDCLARVLEFQGHQVLRLNHVGDWGTQFGMLITHLKQTYPQALTQADALALGDLVTLYRAAKQQFDQDPQFKEAARLAVVDLQAGEPKAKLAWQLLCQQSRQEFQKIYDLLKVELEERGESFYNPYLAEVVAELEQLGLLVKNDGALCVFLEGFTNKEGQPLPLIVQKSDGAYNYATTDLAAIRYRINQDQAQRIIYVTDMGQADHFSQVFQVARRAGWVPPTVELIHVPFGLVQGEDGKKLKTRSGDTVKLQELLDQAIARVNQDLTIRLPEQTPEFRQQVAEAVGIGAVKYADLSQNRSSNYIFSYDKMLALQGNTAPYLMYAYVRVRGISRKGNIDFSQLSTADLIQISEPAEITLAKHLMQFSEAIEILGRELMPNRLCQYLFELSQKFNQFYDRLPILGTSSAVQSSRLCLCDLTARVLQLGLHLLGITVLERM
ncbi:MAG: arginine--tRNA ligase [Pseudanabaenaceae cyanobacterium bins.68]|nr:arginine--tRNA ligase [Pseudanabaenaceae cyanobacterium bins.68]